MSIVYHEHKGFDANHSDVKYCCFVDPGVSVQIFKYGDGRLINTKVFHVDDIANAGFPPTFHLLPEDIRNWDHDIESPPEEMWDSKIISISKNSVLLKYVKFDFPQKRKLTWGEFVWRNINTPVV